MGVRPVPRVIWSAVSSAAVGHQSGIRPAMRTNKTLRELRRRNPIEVSREAKTLSDKLRRQGYLALSPGYPDGLIEAIRDAMAIAEDERFSVAMGGRVKDAVRYIVDPIEHIPLLRELLLPQLIEIVRGWYGTEFAISSVRAWRIGHLPTNEQAFHHYGNLWHVDGHSVDILKLFIQITPDAGLSGSAFRLVSRSDTRKAMRRGYLRSEKILAPARRILDRRVVLFDSPPGGVAFVDTDRCLHRAGVPADGQTRDMVQLMFRPAEQPPPGGDYFASVPKDPNVYEGAIA